jgi:hypothetical protein
MTWNTLKKLKYEIEKTIRLYELEYLMEKTSSLLEQELLTTDEYNYLLYIKSKHLPTILNLGLLPDHSYISSRLMKEYDHITIKKEPGEIVEEEFEIIEQNFLELNLARLK